MLKKERSSNIELLRILSMLGVVILHYNSPENGGAFAAVLPGSLNYGLLYFLEAVFIIAVNLFVLISGFFLSTSQKRNPWKIIWLIVQVSLFSAALYLVGVLLGPEPFSFQTLVRHLIPANYFVILYSALYLISPYLNLVLQALKNRRNALRNMLILLGILFCVWSSLVDLAETLLGTQFPGLSTVSLNGSQQGYSIVNFALMYLIGGYLRVNPPKPVKSWKLLAAFVVNAAILVGWAHFGSLFGRDTRSLAWAYCNPLVIVNAILLFQLFRNWEFCSRKSINRLAEGAFSVFLLHPALYRFFRIPAVVNGNPLFLLGHVLITSVCIYLICWCVWWVYHTVTKPIFTWIEKKIPIPSLVVPLD